MKSGNPDAAEDLNLVIQTKKHGNTRTVEVVSEAASWLKATLKGAGVDFNYASCHEAYYGFAAFTIVRDYRGTPLHLELKIAEIRDTPYMFAEVRSLNKSGEKMFPFFGDLRSEDGRDLLMHYIADFLLSTEPASAN